MRRYNQAQIPTLQTDYASVRKIVKNNSTPFYNDKE